MSAPVPASQPGREPILGSTAPDALTLGRLIDPREGVVERMRYGGDQHVLMFGANGKGKGTRFLIPNLLENFGRSIVCTDPKGELAAVCAPFRRTLGRVVIINPFNLHVDLPGYEDLKSTGFNPLLALDPDAKSFNADTALMAEALIAIEGKEPHFSQSARSLVAALIMYVVIEARENNDIPTMARVRELLCMPSSKAKKHFPAVGIPALVEEMMQSKHAGLRNKAAQLSEWTKEISSIISTARIQTEPFDDPEIAEDMAKTGFDFRDIKRTPITVFLILPPLQMRRHAKWLRLVMTCALLAVLRPRARGEPKVLMLMDEYFSLGQLEIIETVWALSRGYGVALVPVLQSLEQLKKLHPDLWETFLGMAGATLSFSANDRSTATWLSQRSGETTRQITSRSSSTSETKSGGSSATGANSGWSISTNESSSTSQHQTHLITPHRMFGLRPGFMLATIDGLADTIPMYAPPYFQIERCWHRARTNPYYLEDEAEEFEFSA